MQLRTEKNVKELEEITTKTDTRDRIVRSRSQRPGEAR